MINILNGNLTKKKMAGFICVKSQDLDKSLDQYADLGWLKYKKIKGGIYQFTLYPEPVKELTLSNEQR